MQKSRNTPASCFSQTSPLIERLQIFERWPNGKWMEPTPELVSTGFVTNVRQFSLPLSTSFLISKMGAR